MITELAVEGLVEFGNFRKHANKFKKSGYIKLTNLFSYFKALKRYAIIIFIKFMITTGMYYAVISLFGKEDNPNSEFIRRPVIADLSLNLLLDSVMISDLIYIW
jgi:hypothetical protein